MAEQLDEGRPQLAPMGLARRYQISTKKSDRAVSMAYQPETFNSEDTENKFDLMHVRVVIYGLSGVLCHTPVKKKRHFTNTSFSSASTKTSKAETMSKKSEGSPKVETASKKSEGSSTISSKEYPSGEDVFPVQQVPTTAVVSFERKAFSSQTSMFTYIPSLPLGIPVNTLLPNTCRYSASWPADLHSSYLNEECSAADRSSFTFTRVMKHESYVPGQKIHAFSSYVPETIDFCINLGRGKEMIPLGTTSFVITGDEEVEVQMKLPVKPFPLKNKRMAKTPTACRRKASFVDQSAKRFALDDNARLRIGLQVTSNHTLLEAQARAHREQEMMAEFEKFVEEITVVPLDLDDNDYDFFEGSLDMVSKLGRSGDIELEESGSILTSRLYGGGVLSPPSSRPDSYFCGAVICNDRAEMMGDTDNEFILADLTPRAKSLAWQHRLISFRESSVLSSVSESTDGTEITEGGGWLLNQDIVVRRRAQTYSP